MWQPGRKLAVGSLITPVPPPMGTVTHTCHDVVPASLSSVGVRTLSGLQVCLGDTDRLR